MGGIQHLALGIDAASRFTASPNSVSSSDANPNRANGLGFPSNAKRRAVRNAAPFSIARGKNYDIGVVRVSDRRRTEFARSAAYDGMYTWSPDGSHVAFISGRDGTEAVYKADVDGRGVQRLTDTPSINPAWARGR